VSGTPGESVLGRFDNSVRSVRFFSVVNDSFEEAVELGAGVCEAVAQVESFQAALDYSAPLCSVDAHKCVSAQVRCFVLPSSY
jgi:hypothetical protein